MISYSSKLYVHMSRSSAVMQRHELCQGDSDDTSPLFEFCDGMLLVQTTGSNQRDLQ